MSEVRAPSETSPVDHSRCPDAVESVGPRVLRAAEGAATEPRDGGTEGGLRALDGGLEGTTRYG